MTYYPDTFEHAGLHVRLYVEEYIEEFFNPRTDDDGLLGVMFADHRNYDLGDKNAPDPREHVQDDESFEEGIVRYLKEEHGTRVIIPLFLYDHSGITMFCGDRLDKGETFTTRGRYPFDSAGWDTSAIGVIFDTAESRERCGWEERTEEEIEADLRQEVLYYDAYLRGNVQGYEVVKCEPDEDGEVDPESEDCEVLDSMGGFLIAQSEDEHGLKSEARSAAEACAQEIAREATERHEWACRDTVTV